MNPRQSRARVCCPSHPDADLVEDYRAGDLVCPQCGLVVGDRVVDVGTEWRTFSNETSGDDPSRVGGPENPLLESQELTTMIGPATGAAGLDAQGFSKYKNRKNLSSADRALTLAFKEIAAMGDRINLQKTIMDQANLLFKQVYDTKALKGRSTSAIASACLYIACRKEGVPRTFKEICAVSCVSKKDIGRCFKLIIKTVEPSQDGVKMITTGDFMPRFCGNLGLANAIQKAATHIAQKASELDVVPGRSPISVAAAAIFMAVLASKDKHTAKEIGEIAGVAETTIRATYKHLINSPHSSKLFPANFKFEVPLELLPRS